eukprot:302728_1
MQKKKKLWKCLIADGVFLTLLTIIFFSALYGREEIRMKKLWESNISGWFIPAQTVWYGSLLIFKGSQVLYALDNNVPGFLVYILVVISTAFIMLIALVWYIMGEHLMFTEDMLGDGGYVIISILIIYVYVAWIVQEYINIISPFIQKLRSKQLNEASKLTEKDTYTTQAMSSAISSGLTDTKYSHQDSKQVEAILYEEVKLDELNNNTLLENTEITTIVV